MKRHTKLSIQWFYDLLEKGECDIVDFKEHFDDRDAFAKPHKSFSGSYEELSRDVVAFANKKGGFLIVGIEDKTKDINPDFQYNDKKLYELIKSIQDRTQPSITLIPHKLKVRGKDLLVLEVPFSTVLHCTSKGEYLIRSNNGNRAILPYEMSTLMSEKGMLVYDQTTWDLRNWQDQERVGILQRLISKARPDSPLLKDSIEDFNDLLSLTKEEDGKIRPTLTGILFTGTDRALREIPYSEIKYIRYFEDGTYTPFEWKGNLIEMAEKCFTQLQAEIHQREMNFGLFHETIEDYSRVVLRELLINALAHRDYSRQQIIEIRRYPDYIEFESPGLFPQGINCENFLWKTNARNPEIMEIFRAIKFAEKAGSGWDKIFTELLSKGKTLPVPEETDTSVIFRVEAAVVSDTMIEISHHFQRLTNRLPSVEQLLILNEIVANRKLTIKELAKAKFISDRKLKHSLDELIELGFIESSGHGSGTVYLIHKRLLRDTAEKIRYVRNKKQEKAIQKEAILRYLDSMETISNSEARMLLNLPDSAMSYVSRLLSEMVKDGQLIIITPINSSRRKYARKKRKK